MPDSDKQRTETKCAAPGLLIAVPSLRDPNFSHSVILMVEHSSEGAMGLVLNQQSDATVEQLCADQGIETRRQDAVHIGGPVSQERIWLIHPPRPDLEDKFPIADGIEISYTMQSLIHLSAEEQSPMIVCAGYAGWGPGQLEQEIEEGAWLLYPVSPNMIFSGDPDLLWDHLILHFSNFGVRRPGTEGAN